jgi:hypothetical protein
MLNCLIKIVSEINKFTEEDYKAREILNRTDLMRSKIKNADD